MNSAVQGTADRINVGDAHAGVSRDSEIHSDKITERRLARTIRCFDRIISRDDNLLGWDTKLFE
jgi:hypothetical protein